MCGICGIVGPSASQGESRGIVKKMMTLLAHRGPDGEGLVTGTNFIFGHKRLAVIDIEFGAQPMQSADGNITIVYNGEIYNYLELRQELIQRGARFNTFSDTEVLLKLYEEHGRNCVDYLNGMFAFGIYDARQNLFWGARDHFGMKPFYYFLLPDGGLVFASEIKALFRHPEIQPHLDPVSLNQYLTFQFCLNRRTLFKNIKKLEPAQYLLWQPGKDGLVYKKFWNMNYSIDIHHTEEYFSDKLLLLLQDSIRGQLRSDVPVGAYLSGGVDSSCIVCLAKLQFSKEFKCFTGKFSEGQDYDESQYSKLLADFQQCKLYEVIPSAEDFVELLPKLIYYMDEPAAGPGLFPQYMVSKLAKEQVTVVLGGQGGDEIFGGYARYLIAYLEQCLKGAIFETQEEGRYIVELESIIPNLSILQQYVPMLKAFWRAELFEPMDQRYFRLIDRSHDLKYILHPDIWSQYNRKDVFDEFSSIFNHPDTLSYFNKMTHFDQQTLLPAILQVDDRVGMAVSLESRMPFLDPRIAQLVASMPPGIKFKGGKTKYVLKQAMASLLPKPILERKDKMGFPVPLKEWWGGPLHEFVSDILLSKSCRDRGLFDLKGLQKLIQKEDKFGRQIWGALCIELWHRVFFDGKEIQQI